MKKLLMKNRSETKVKSKKVKYGNGIFIVIGVILALHIITLVLPFIWMVITSFKGLIDFQKSFLGLPQKWHFENYTEIFSILKIQARGTDGILYDYGVDSMLINSLTMALFGPAFSLLGMILCSYIVAKYNFIGKKFLFNLNIFVMIIPIVGTLANTLTVYKQFGIYNNMWKYIILPYTPFGFNFLLMYGVWKGIPDSYAEAVTIDGGGHWTIFTKISLPLAMPTIFTLYNLGFISRWNDYNASLVFLPSVPNLAYGLYEFQYNASKYGAILPEILAAFVVCSIPSVVLFACSQKIIIKSLMIGGLKG